MFGELQYFALGAQTNVYSITQINLLNDAAVLLVATLKGKVFSIDIRKVKPVSKEIQFTYIPGEAQLISIDAFRKIETGRHVIGISFVKVDEGEKLSHYLNIYSDWDYSREFDLDCIAQCCQNLELPFVPLHLYHAIVKDETCTTTVLLLSGMDQRIHMYCEDGENHQFVEKDVSEYFPEFNVLPYCVTQIYCEYLDATYTKRLTVYGCQNGTTVMSLVDCSAAEPVVSKSWTAQLDGPVTSLCVFADTTRARSDTDLQLPAINLLITTAMEVAVVCRNILYNGFSEPCLLQNSGQHDSVLCGLAADIDFDGNNEILLGTYGQELMAYKFNTVQSQLGSRVPSQRSADDTTSRGSMSRTQSMEGATKVNYYLKWQRSLSDPIMGLRYIDVTGDGLRELAVLSLRGVHILQHDLKEAARICTDRLQQVASNEHLRQELLNFSR